MTTIDVRCEVCFDPESALPARTTPDPECQCCLGTGFQPKEVEEDPFGTPEEQAAFEKWCGVPAPSTQAETRGVGEGEQ